MRNLLERLSEVLSGGGAAVLAAVTAGRGSVPRGAGAQMLVEAAGRTRGTVGGGAVEHEAEVRAQALGGEIYTVRLRLYELEERLDRKAFVRVSHSEIVNWKRVTALDLSLSGTIRVTLEGGVVTYVSRRYVKKIKEVLGI